MLVAKNVSSEHMTQGWAVYRLEWPMRRSGGTKLPNRDKWPSKNEILSLEEMELQAHF